MYKIPPLRSFQVLSKELTNPVIKRYYDQANLNSKLLTQQNIEITPSTKHLAVLRLQDAYLRVVAGDRAKPYSWLYSSPLAHQGSLLFELNKTKEIDTVAELQKGVRLLKASFQELDRHLQPEVFSMDTCKDASSWLYKLIRQDQIWGNLTANSEYSLKYVRRLGNARNSALLFCSINKSARRELVLFRSYYTAVSRKHFYNERFQASFPQTGFARTPQNPGEETPVPQKQMQNISQISLECFQQASGLLKIVNRELQKHNPYFYQEFKTSSYQSSAQAWRAPSSSKW